MAIDLEALYIDLHRHPELSFQETRTAGVITRELAALGLDYVEGLGKTGVATRITGGAGEGPVVWLRADMDGLPVAEQTGLAYASTARGTDPAGTDVPVMHACGHDMHVTALLGALEKLAQTRDEWSGTVVAVFQPAEEYGAGSQAMIADGVLDAFPKPDVVLGQHLTPLPAGTIGVRPGHADGRLGRPDGDPPRPRRKVTPPRHDRPGRDGGGDRHAAADDRLREVDPREMAVVTVGSIHAGLKNNIIPAEARLELSLRYPDDDARADVMARVERIVRAEAAASGAEQEPVIAVDHSLPPTINDPDATARLTAAFDRAFRRGHRHRPRHVHRERGRLVVRPRGGGSARVLVLGRARPAAWADAAARGTVNEDIPTNHSPFFAPILHPTIERSVDALVVAAREFLA